MAVTETGHLASREVDDLYRRHGPEVYRYAYAVLGNHADAEDVTQTPFLNASRSLASGTKPRKAERALGAQAFTDKYGTNANKANAFGKCVSKLAKEHGSTS